MITGYHRDTWAEVNLSAIEDNIHQINARCKENNIGIMAVVKAGGYGHGAVEVAKAALKAGVSFLVVSLLDEAIELREAGIAVPILILGWTKPEYVSTAVKYDLTLTVLNLDWLIEAKKHLGENDQIRVHVKVDTGMGRFGVRSDDEIDELFQYIQENEKLYFLEGVFTHYATADEADLNYMEKQHHRFCEMIEFIKKKGLNIPIIHNGNSAFGLRFPTKVFQFFRLGISMYGLTPAPAVTEELPPLKPAFSLKSRLVQVKKLSPGEAVGYGAKYRTKQDEWIGTLQIGYADGWLRENSAKGGEVLVEGKRAQLVGPICMDQCMVKLPGPVKLGTIVTLIGKDGNDEITMEEVAERLGTINYEIPCIIAQRVPRVYIKDEK